MTKADWLDFFEAINGRSATEEEIAAALAAGEFQDDAPAVETAPVQEAPVQPAFASAQETLAQEAQPQPTFAGAQEAQQQPTFAGAQEAQPQAPFANAQAAQAQPSFAGAQTAPVQGVPNQAVQPQAGFANAQAGQQTAFANGQPLQPGQNVQFINGQAVVVPAQPSAFATTFKNYWTWLLNAWRRPADMTDYGKHNGWLNYIFLSLLTGLAFFAILSAVARKVVSSIVSTTNVLSSMFGSYGTDAYSSPVSSHTSSIGFGAFFASILAAFLFIFAFILAGFVTRKAIFRDPETTFLNSFDRFGRLTSLALPILLVTILLGAIGLVAFPGFLFYVVYFLFAIANLFTIVPVTTAWKADKFYQMILAALLNGVILSKFIGVFMATKEKWIDLFEKAVGRPPHVLEIEEGQKADFDLKAIKGISAMGLDQEATPSEPTEEVDEYDVAEEVFEDVPLGDEEETTPLETKELSPVSQADQGQTEKNSEAASKEAQAIWMKAFKTYVGRQPLPEEFLLGKSSGYDVSTIHQFISDGKAAKPAKPAMAKGKKILIIAGVVAAVLALASYGFGSYYYSRGQVAERYEAAAKKSFKDSLEYQVWSDTKKEIKTSEVKYTDTKSTQAYSKSQLLSGERMQKVGRQFLIFPKWRVVVDPGTVDLTVNTADLNVTINGVSYVTTDGNNYTAKLNHLYPGTYNFVASGKVNDQDITVSSEENVTSKTEVNLSVEYLSFTVKSNLKDGDLYVGGTKIGTLNSGKFDVNKVAVAGSSAVYVKKNFEDGSSIKTETLSIKKISEGQTVTLDADGVLDRDTADRLLTAAYGKFGSYASNHNTTPDGVSDIFLNGTDDSMYKDVTADIDRNTTGAKNRAAGSRSDW